jgi:glutathione-regulated potassium-efflux system ancillary protein KefG
MSKSGIDGDRPRLSMAVVEKIVHPVLVLFAHPAIRKSRVNRRLIEVAQSVDGATVNDLYEAYPDLDIDVEREQQLLTEHDVIVMQHPFYWYSTPSILKEWQDLVLEHGWAYGHDGHALEGKILVNAISTGGSEPTYCEQGTNRFSMQQLLAPIEQTARLCGMEYLPPFVVHGTHGLEAGEIDHHVADYRRVLEGLRDGRVTPDRAAGLRRLNADLDALMVG